MLAAALALSLASAPSAAALVSSHVLLGQDVQEAQPAPQSPAEAAPAPTEEAAPAEPAPAPKPTLDELTRRQLESDLVKLEARKPSYVGSVFACGVGAVVIGWSIYIAIVGTVLSGAMYWIAIGAAVFIAGGGLAAVGVYRLFSTIHDRRLLSQQMDDIRERLTPVPAVTLLTF